jgi:hypothetical protein
MIFSRVICPPTTLALAARLTGRPNFDGEEIREEGKEGDEEGKGEVMANWKESVRQAQASTVEIAGAETANTLNLDVIRLDASDDGRREARPDRRATRAALFAARKQILGAYQPRQFKPALTDQEFEERQQDDLRAVHGESFGGYQSGPRAELPHKTPTEVDRERIAELVRALLDKLGQDSDGADWAKLNGQFLNIVDRLAVFRLQLADVIEPYQARAILSLLNERKQKILARKEQQAMETVGMLDRAERGDEAEISFGDLYDLFVGAGLALATHPDCETNASRVRDALRTIEEFIFTKGDAK